MDDVLMHDASPEVVKEGENCYLIQWSFGGFRSFVFRCSRSFDCHDLQGGAFSASDSEWRLDVVNNSFIFAEENDVWITFHLQRVDERICPKRVEGIIGLKKMDGTIQQMKEMSHQFIRKGERCEMFHCMRSELQKMAQLIPSGVLIIACRLRIIDDWSCPSRFSYLTNMFLMKSGCDETLKVRNGEFFPVHKSILASRSPVFRNMFQENTELDNINFRPEPFRDFLMFVYNGKTDNSSGDFLELYKIAHKYQVEELKNALHNYICRNISVDNVIDFFIFSQDCEDGELMSKCQEFFDRRFEDVRSTNKWKSLVTQKPDIARRMLINRPDDLNALENYLRYISQFRPDQFNYLRNNQNRCIII